MGVGHEANIVIHEHARKRMAERGADEAEVLQTVRKGEPYPAKHGRSGFRMNHAYDKAWLGRHYAIKQIEAIAVQESDVWVVVTVMTKYF